jgi:hypothetical protein
VLTLLYLRRHEVLTGTDVHETLISYLSEAKRIGIFDRDEGNDQYFENYNLACWFRKGMKLVFSPYEKYRSKGVETKMVLR